MMEKDNIQKELFNEFQQPKRQSRRFGQFFQKGDFGVSLNAEKLVFVSIGLTMLLVAAFALGVERGKAVSSVQAQPAVVTVAQPQAKVVKVAPAVKAAPATSSAVKKAQPVAQTKPAAQERKADDKTKPYTIVAAAFTKEAFAAAEVGRLKANSIDAFVLRGDPYYLACVGAFASKESARATLNRVRQLDRDAYVRLK